MHEILSKYLPEIAAAHGQQLDDMLVLVHWLMAFLFVVWGSFFLYCIFRFRAGKNPQANYVGVKSHVSQLLEVGVAVIEVALIVGFAMPLWAERVNEFPEETDATVVRVVAEQFVWNIHYPGADGIFGSTDINLIDAQSNPLGLDKNDENGLDDVVTVNQLHLPVNIPAIIHLSSKDVIHSFGVPEMRVKQDAIPGMSIPMWFTPTVTTEEMRKRKGNEKFTYEIACAQLCGIGHRKMKGFVTIHQPDEYTAWLSSQEPAVSSEDEDDIWN